MPQQIDPAGAPAPAGACHTTCMKPGRLLINHHWSCSMCSAPRSSRKLFIEQPRETHRAYPNEAAQRFVSNSAPPSAGHDLLVRVNAIGQPRWHTSSAAAWVALFDRLGIDRNGGNRDQLLIVRGAGGVGRSPSNSPSLPETVVATASRERLSNGCWIAAPIGSSTTVGRFPRNCLRLGARSELHRKLQQ